MAEINRILIIQSAFIGDVVLTTPLIQAAKFCFSNAVIDVLVIPGAKNLLENNPNIRQVIGYDKRASQRGVLYLWQLSHRLRQQKYDLVLSPHRSIRSAILAVFSGARMRIGFDTSAGRWLFTHTIHYRNDWHEVERNLSLLSPFKCKNQRPRMELFPSALDEQRVDQLLNQEPPVRNKTRIAIAPGSVWATKKWPEEYFIRLAEKVIQSGYLVWLIGGKTDRELCEKIAAKVGKNIYNVAGALSLLQSAALIKRCRVLISNDSAPQHLGVAVGTPIITIFGSTVPAFGFAPFGAGNRTVEIELECRPCGIHGHKKCPLGTLDCLKKILPEQVLAVFAELLQEQYVARA